LAPELRKNNVCLRTKAGVKNAATRNTPVLNFGVDRQGTQFRRKFTTAVKFLSVCYLLTGKLIAYVSPPLACLKRDIESKMTQRNARGC
jgi:hypothetical protein